MIQSAKVLHDATATRPDARSVEIRRVFTVSPEALWEYFTDPAHNLNWAGPKQATCTRFDSDPRVGGAWAMALRLDDGEEVVAHGVYREIEKPRRLVYTWRWESWEETSPDSLVSLAFEARGQGSMLTLTHSELPEDEVEGHEGGWMSALECLNDYIESM
jgi:uncharacterized protein YndB with AHSA1/START domain